MKTLIFELARDILIRLTKLLYLFVRKKEGFIFIRADMLGDLFVSFPFFLRYLKQQNHLFVVRDFIAPVYRLFTDKVVAVDSNDKRFLRSLSEQFIVFNKLFRYKYSNTVNLTHQLLPFQPAGFGWFVGKYTCSENKFFYGEDYWRAGFDDHLNLAFVPGCEIKSYEHVFLKEMKMFNHFEELHVPDIKAFYADAFCLLKERNKQAMPYKNYVVILTDAGFDYRRYPAESWQAVIDGFGRDIPIVRMGLLKMKLKHPNLTDLTGKTSLLEAIWIVQHADMVIGNETGLIHLAYLSGVPSVCILGGGHFGRFLPWEAFEGIVECVFAEMGCFGCNWKCAYVDLSRRETPPCISSIRPEKVVEAVKKISVGCSISKPL